MADFPIQLSLIPHEMEKSIIPQRAVDGYINATEMCKSVDKKLNDYGRLGSTKAFLDELFSVTGIPVTELVQVVQGGIPELQGTWVHPQVAINLGQWLSPKFAVAVSKWVLDWMTGNNRSRLPIHLQRYLMNRNQIPPTHFSILNEITYNLVAPLESMGYVLPENIVPDISEGIMFSAWLKKKGMDLSSFPTYKHEYPDGRIFDARLYPNELLAEFRKHFNEVWLPGRAHGYFKKKDDRALPHLKKVLALNASFERNTKKLGKIS